MTDSDKEIARLRRALQTIASLDGQTLLGVSDDLDPDHSHHLGAAKAFNQAAQLAQLALDDPQSFTSS